MLLVIDKLEVPPFLTKWGIELGSLEYKHKIAKILNLTHSSAIDIRKVEMNYKCLTRWYATSDKLSKYHLEKSHECWRGCKVTGTMAHLWWNCTKMNKYWKEILQLILEITGKAVVEDQWTVLFHGTEGFVKQDRESIIPHLLNAAKSLIPKK